MSATSDNAVHIGKESTFNTAVTTTRSYPISADTYQLELSELSYDEMIAGQVAGNPSNMEYYLRGGVGSMPKTARTSGDGLLWEAALGSSSITGTVQTHTTDADPSSTSLTIQAVKSGFDGTPQVYTFTGGVVTEWSLEHSAGDTLKTDFQFFWQDFVTTTAAGTAAYPTGKSWLWKECDIKLGGYTFVSNSFNFSCNNGLNTDEDFLATTQPKAVRKGKIEASGSIEMPANADTKALIAESLDNPLDDSLVVTWQKADGNQELLKLECPVVRIKPVLPEMSIDDLTKVTFEFMVADPASDPAITITYDTKSDTAY